MRPCIRLACLNSLTVGLGLLLSLPLSASAQQVTGPTPAAPTMTTPPAAEPQPPTASTPYAPAEIVPAAPTSYAPVDAVTPAAPAEVTPPSSESKADDSKKWVPTFYGFAELDTIADSTQSFNDLAGNQAIARPNSYAQDHGRMTFGVRNSRIGMKLAAPQLGEWKASAQLEMDFLANYASGTAESAIFTSPFFRVRHANIKLESPYVDLLFGQYWNLFGWGTYFHPNSVEIQGLPGQVFSRTPQVRVSHRFKGDAVDFELAIAASRPPQRNSFSPDGQLGARLFVNNWKGVHTTGGAGTAADSAAIGVSAVTRRFAVPQFSATPKNSTSKYGWGFSADAMLPIVPASMDDRSNGLTLTGSFVRGEGIADLFTGLSGGVTTFPGLPNNAMGMAQTYASDVDAGDVMFDAKGKLQTVGWQAVMVGLQYYFPGSGKVWVSANYTNMSSHNAADLTNGKPGNVFNKSQFADLNLFWDPLAQVRFGIEGAFFEQTYVDNVKAHNVRAQFSSWFIF
jgi:hypothetical protein